MPRKKTVRTYVKPNEVNDWEYRTVYLGPIVYSAAGTVGTNSQTAPKMGAGKYWVQWPDGHEELVSVVMKKYHTSYNDMGNRYEVTGELPYITIDHHGAKIELMVMDAKIKVAVPEDK